jgi:hypothetical protein
MNSTGTYRELDPPTQLRPQPPPPNHSLV